MSNKKTEKRFILQLFTGLAAVLFLAAGIAGGEVDLVFEKAVRVCLECIGIG